MHFGLVIPADVQIPPCGEDVLLLPLHSKKRAPNQSKRLLPKTARELLGKEEPVELRVKAGRGLGVVQ